jgi:hypothetical protein
MLAEGWVQGGTLIVLVWSTLGRERLNGKIRNKFG